MDVIELLLAEHRHIGRILDRLEQECRLVREGAVLRPRLFRRAAFFLSEHVDASHQEKERELFRALAPYGLQTAPASVQRIVHEHESTAEHGVRICQLAERFECGIGDVEELLSAVTAYVRHFREHAREEEAEVFPLARRLLVPQAKELLRSRVAKVQATHLPIEEAAAALERAFGTEPALHIVKAYQA